MWSTSFYTLTHYVTEFVSALQMQIKLQIRSLIYSYSYFYKFYGSSETDSKEMSRQYKCPHQKMVDVHWLKIIIHDYFERSCHTMKSLLLCLTNDSLEFIYRVVSCDMNMISQLFMMFAFTHIRHHFISLYHLIFFDYEVCFITDGTEHVRSVI